MKRLTGRGGVELRFEFATATAAAVWDALCAIGVRAMRATGRGRDDVTVIRIALPRSRVEVVVLACLAYGGRYLRPFQFPPIPASSS